MINKVTLIGNLGRDPEVRHFESGSSVAQFSVATNENYQDKEGEWQTRTEWHLVVAWRGLALRAEKALKKGSLVYVEGRLRTRKYNDSQGVERTITEIEAQLLRPLDRRENQGAPLPTEDMAPSGGSISTGGSSKPESTNTSKPDSGNDTSKANDEFVADDDLPF